eukprot:gene4966-6051_t
MGRQSSLYQDLYPCTVGAAQVVQVGASTLVTMMALVERKEQVAWMTLYVLASSTMVNGGIPTAITASDTAATTSEVCHYAIMNTATLFNTQPYNVGHAVVALTTVLVKETARHIPPYLWGAIAVMLTGHAGDVDSSIPLCREDDVEALHCLDAELNVIMGPQAGFEGEGAWSDEKWNALHSMLRRTNGFMAITATDLPGYTGEIGKFDIPFKDESTSHHHKPRRLSPVERGLIGDHFNKLLEADIIGKAPKYCDNTCNVVVAMKNALDGSWTDTRVTLDLRGINELSLKDRKPPRSPEDLSHDIGKDQYITKLDLRSGLRQIVLTDDASLKTCFWAIEHELRGLNCAKVYCDDILITSPTAQQHIADLEATMERLSKVGLRGHPGKSVFAAGGCEFLGFCCVADNSHRTKLKLPPFATFQRLPTCAACALCWGS